MSVSVSGSWLYCRDYRPSLPVLMVSTMRDVLWGDLDMTHQGRSSKSGDSFLSSFPHPLNSKDLSRKRRSFLMKYRFSANTSAVP